MRRTQIAWGIAILSLALGAAAQGIAAASLSDSASLRALDQEAEQSPHDLSDRSPLLRQECNGRECSNVQHSDQLVHEQLSGVIQAEDSARIQPVACAAQGTCLDSGTAAHEQAATSASRVAQQAREAAAALSAEQERIEKSIDRIQRDVQAAQQCADPQQREQPTCGT